jgi:hypothetical protein
MYQQAELALVEDLLMQQALAREATLAVPIDLM